MARHRLWKAANTEHLKAWAKDYEAGYGPRRSRLALQRRRADPERYRQRQRAYRRKRPEVVQRASKKWRELHPAQVRRYKKKYAARPIVRIRMIERVNRRRDLYRQTDISVEWLLELENKTTSCADCGRVLAAHHRYPDGKHLDHIIPLSKGGRHLKDNVRYICAKCNIRKSAKIEKAKSEDLALAPLK